MSPLQTHLRYLPKPLQHAVLRFSALPGPQRTVERLVSLVDGHLEAYGMAGDARRAQYLSSALAVARLRYNVVADRRSLPREPAVD